MKIIVTLICLFLLAAVPSCRPSPPLDTLTPQLEEAKSQIASLEGELSQAQGTITSQQAQLDDFAAQLTTLWEQRNKAAAEIDKLKRQYDSLLAKQNPWPGLNMYADPNRTISVKTGEEFVLRYDLGNEIFIQSIDESHDVSFIAYEARQGSYQDLSDSKVPGVAWYQFKAVKPGVTQIKLSHIGHFGYGPLDIEIYNVVITD